MRGAMQIAERLGAAVLATFLVMPAAAQTCPGVVGVEDFDEYNQEPDDVAMDGDYAYTADTYGLTVYDLSDPTHPAPVAQVLLPDDGVGIALSGGMAYVADASGILHVIDISDPTAPAEVGSIQTPGVARDVAVSGTLAVVGITVTSVYSIDPQGALQVVDVSDPASPTLRGIVGTATYEDAVVLSGTHAYCGGEIFDLSNPGAPTVVGVVAGRAVGFATSGSYLLTGSGTSLHIVDVSDPGAPITVGSVGLPDEPLSAAVSGSTAYVADALAGLKIVDISNLAAPSVIGSVDVPDAQATIGTAVAGALVVMIQHAPAGLAVVDVSEPGAPLSVGALDPRGDARDLAVSGSYAFVADWEGGLRVIDIADPAAPALLGSVDTGWRTWAVAASGSTAYVAGLGMDLQVVDASNPALPTVVGSTTAYGYGYYRERLLVAGSTLFAAVGSLQIIDVSDPTTPETLGSLSSWWNANDVALEGTTAFVAGGGGPDYGVLVVLDTTDQTAPTVIGTMESDAAARAVAVYGSHVLLGTGYDSAINGLWRNSLYVIDVADPTTPTVTGSLDLPDVPNSITVSGSNALVADSSGGLIVVDVSTPSAPRILERIPTSRSAAGVGLSDATGTAWVASGPILEAMALGCAGCAGLDVEAIPASVTTGGDTTTVTVTVHDLLDNALSGQLVSGTSDLGTVTSFTDNGDGTYDAVFTSGSVSGTAHINLSVNGDSCTTTGEVEVVCAGGAADVPSGLEVTSITDGSITLEWDVSSGAVGYTVYRDGQVMDTIGDGSTVTFTDTDVLPGTEHCYQVSATDACGGETSRSERVCGSSTGRPASCVHPLTADPMDFLNSGDVRDAAVSGDLLATADEYGATLWDVSDPSLPVRIGTVEAPASGAAVVFAASDRLLLLTTEPSLQVVDTSNPATPTIVGSVGIPGFDPQAVAVSGSTALVAAGDLQVVDISDVTAPVVTGSAVTPGAAYGVAVSGSIVVVADNDGGLQVVDVTNPVVPTITGSLALPGRARGVAVSGTTACVADADGGLQVVDFSDPTAPYIMGAADTFGWASRVVLSGPTVFITSSDMTGYPWEQGLLAVDVSDPAAPAVEGWVGTPDRPGGLTVAGSEVYLGVRSHGLHVIDVSDPTALSVVGVTETPGWVEDVAVAGSIAILADGKRGVKVFDVSEPTTPVLVGEIDTPRCARMVASSGDVAVVADGDCESAANNGLYVVDFSSPTVPTIISSVDGLGYIGALAMQGSTAYVVSKGVLGLPYAGLEVLDVSDPTAPALVGSVSTGTGGEGIAVAGTTVFIADQWDGLRVVDASDPTSPAIIGSLALPQEAYGIAVSGDTAFVADSFAGLIAVDVSEPGSPTIIGSVDTPPYAREVAVWGTTAVVADAYGLNIVDVFVPATPEIVAWSPTARFTTGSIAVSGSHAFIAEGAYLDIMELACTPTCNEFSAASALEPLMPNEIGSITASATDLEGDPLPSLALSGTATAGTVGTFADNGDGSYTAPYTAPGAEQAATVSVNIDGFECGVDLLVEVVCPTLQLGMTPSPLPSGEVGTLDIAVDDPRGAALPGLDLDLSATAGSLGSVTDHGDGTYAASFTAPGGVQTVTVSATDLASGCSDDLVFQVGTCSDPLTLESETISDTRTIDWCGPVIVGPAVSVEATGVLEILATGSIEVRNGFSVAAGGTATFTLQP